MKDSLYLAAMLRRFTREKEEMRKTNTNMAPPGLAEAVANKLHSTNSKNHLLATNSTHLQGNTVSSDLSLADLTSDPAVMSLLGSANEKELQDLLGDLDFGLADTEQQHAMAAARENGILGVGVPGSKGAAAAGGSGHGRGPGSSSGLFSPPLLPEGLPAPLIKRIEDLRAVSQQWAAETQMPVEKAALHVAKSNRNRLQKCLRVIRPQAEPSRFFIALKQQGWLCCIRKSSNFLVAFISCRKDKNHHR